MSRKINILTLFKIQNIKKTVKKYNNFCYVVCVIIVLQFSTFFLLLFYRFDPVTPRPLPPQCVEISPLPLYRLQYRS